MPNTMIHEKVGFEIGKRIHKNSYDYYLGLLAPDAPNLDGFAPKEERWRAHQRKKNRKEWRENLNFFYEKVKKEYPEDFLLGYYIHILTDIIYDDFLYDEVREEIEKTISHEEAHDAMREDMDKYYFEEIEEIRNCLKEQNKSYAILNISKEKLDMWKEKEVSVWKHSNTSRYITEKVVKKLEEKVYEELVNQ